MRVSSFFAGLLLAVAPLPAAPSSGTPPPDSVIQQFVKAVGGADAVARIETRQVEMKRRHGPKLTYYWQKPDKVLLVEGKKKIAYDGGSGWILSSKKHVTRLPKGSQTSLEMDANPLRYAHLEQLYPDVQLAPAVTLDGRRMDALVSPNDRGATHFYFDAATHLLVRIEETGETSAYFKHTTGFSDYQEVDGVRLPYRIVHDSTEPGVGTRELRVVKVTQNVPLKPGLFSKPSSGTVVLGGKR